MGGILRKTLTVHPAAIPANKRTDGRHKSWQTKHRLRMPCCRMRFSSSSRAELEGAHTSTRARLLTPLLMRTGLAVAIKPKQSSGLPTSQGLTASLHAASGSCLQ